MSWNVVYGSSRYSLPPALNSPPLSSAYTPTSVHRVPPTTIVVPTAGAPLKKGFASGAVDVGALEPPAFGHRLVVFVKVAARDDERVDGNAVGSQPQRPDVRGIDVLQQWADLRFDRAHVAVLDRRRADVVLIRVDADRDAQITERVERAGDAAGRGFADTEHRDGRRRADDHAEQRQDRARAVAPDGGERFADVRAQPGHGLADGAAVGAVVGLTLNPSTMPTLRSATTTSPGSSPRLTIACASLAGPRVTLRFTALPLRTTRTNGLSAASRRTASPGMASTWGMSTVTMSTSTVMPSRRNGTVRSSAIVVITWRAVFDGSSLFCATAPIIATCPGSFVVPRSSPETIAGCAGRMFATSCSSTRARTMKPPSAAKTITACPTVTVSPGCSARRVSVVWLATFFTTPDNGATMRIRLTCAAAYFQSS